MAAKKMDRRVRKTREQLKIGLAKLMERKSIREITVKELVEEVDINRSTFYLHYSDIYQMLDQIEEEMEQEVISAIKNNPLDPLHATSYPFISQIFTFLSKNRDICRALLGPNGDMNFVEKMEKLIGETVLQSLPERLPVKESDVKYGYAFCLTGCIGLVRIWLEHPEMDSPEHMAEVCGELIDGIIQHHLAK